MGSGRDLSILGGRMTAFQGQERCSTLIKVRAIVIQDTEGAQSLICRTSVLHRR